MTRFLRLFFLTFFALMVCALGYAYWLCFKAQSLIDGKIQLAGLKCPVEVIRDDIGIPHILAQTFDDAIFAQGYVTAQDRLWQMDLLRRLGYGELSEIFGPRALESDKEQRILGFKHLVAKQERNLPPADLHCLQRYTEGVNAFIGLHRDRLPVEFHVLGYKPSAWSPRDTLVLNLWMGKLLSTSWNVDLMREMLYQKLDRRIADEFMVEFSPNDLLVVGSDNLFPAHQPYSKALSSSTALTQLPVSSLAFDQLRPLLALLDPTGLSEPVGSNNWVVAGERTAGGKPILANDPHLPPGVPSIWYMAHLEVPGILNVIGVTIPGAPGIILGHNENIAWGATNLGPDVQDLYIEKLHPQDPNRYLVNGDWQEIEQHQEIITVKGAKPEILKVRSTRHGPVLRELDSRVLALRWTILEERISVSIATKLNTARNWEEFLLAMQEFCGPVQNFVYADRQGNIAFLNAGKIPIRKQGDGSVPVPGETNDYEWTGYIPFDELPRSFNPASGMIVTANNRIVGKSYSHFLTHNWISPHRAHRIRQLLETKTKLKVVDMLKIQGDVHSSIHQIISTSILEAISHSNDLNKRQLDPIKSQLENWDYVASENSIGTTLCEEFRKTFLEEMLRNKLGEDWTLYQWFNSSTLVENMLRTRNMEFLPPKYSTYDEFILACLSEVQLRLKSRYKTSDLNSWRWGDYFPVEFRHPLGLFWPLTKIFNTGPYPQAGTPLTVKQTSSRVGVSMRMVVDFSDLDQSLNNLPLGQSGQIFSQHYRDQFDHWLKVQSYPMLFSLTKIKKAAVATLLLQP
jgi:penicillin amidase